MIGNVDERGEGDEKSGKRVKTVKWEGTAQEWEVGEQGGDVMCIISHIFSKPLEEI
jgi:hypothetical protein